MAVDFSDAYWQLTASSDEDATIQASPLPKLPLELQAPTTGSASLLDRLQHAADTQEAVTVEGAELVDYKLFLGDVLIDELKDHERLSLTFSVAPVGPIINSILRIRGTDVELPDIALGLYVLPGHGNRWRLTNRQDLTSPVIVTVDFTWQPSDAPDNVIYLTAALSLTVESRPVPGRTIRDLLTLHAFLHALREPRVLDIVDRDTLRIRFVARGVHFSRLDSSEELLFDAFNVIQDAFPTNSFLLPDRLGRDDARKVFEVADIVRSGEATIEAHEMSADMSVETLANLLDHTDEHGVLQYRDSRGVFHHASMSITQKHTIHTILGVSLDLGPSRADFPAMKFIGQRDELRREVKELPSGSIIPIQLIPADPTDNRVHYQYSHYRLAVLTGLRNNGERALTEAEQSELDDLVSVAKREMIDVPIPPELMRAYFPTPPEAPNADDLRLADERWQEARERGRRYRAEAQAQVGPLLTPAETAQRLGVSPVTVNKWRRQNKLLGLRFDDHQYVYPLFQFAESPLQGERGVLRHLDGVLRALGERTAWEKAIFLLAPHPRLGGQTPLEVLRQEPSADMLDRLSHLAHHAGAMGA